MPIHRRRVGYAARLFLRRNRTTAVVVRNRSTTKNGASGLATAPARLHTTTCGRRTDPGTRPGLGVPCRLVPRPPKARNLRQCGPDHQYGNGFGVAQATPSKCGSSEVHGSTGGKAVKSEQGHDQTLCSMHRCPSKTTILTSPCCQRKMSLSPSRFPARTFSKKSPTYSTKERR
jgi:hypothetical protein